MVPGHAGKSMTWFGQKENAVLCRICYKAIIWWWPQMNLPTGHIYISDSFSPWHNQAFEEQLLHEAQPQEFILYLWRNRNTVFVGRHQNAWRECDWQALAADGGRLARRISGGGAVFHDLGNLNFTFIRPRTDYDLQSQLDIILQAVRSLGIEAEFSGRNDLLAAGRKFSGNAFCHQRANSLHHGTLLVQSDLSALQRYLRPSPEKISSKGVESLRQRVVNLRELAPSLQVADLQEALCHSFAACCCCSESRVVDTSLWDMGSLYEKYASWQWRFGAAPRFSWSLERRFPWGEVQLCLSAQQGLIKEAAFFSDAMDADLITRLEKALPALPLLPAAIAPIWRQIAKDDKQIQMVEDLIAWLEERLAQT
jgi:lipoate-protein ligase A